MDILKSLQKNMERKLNTCEIAFDLCGGVQMVQNLKKLGFILIKMGQGFEVVSPSTKELMY